MRFKTLMLAAGLMSLAVSAAADQAEARRIYKDANAAFKAKNYGQAIELYKQVEAEEPSYSSYVQSWLGYSYYFLKDEGKALYHFEQHLKNKPDDAKVKKYADHLRSQGILPDSGGTGKTLSGEKMRSNVIYVNPAGLAFGLINAGYERAITDHNSFLVDGAFQTISVGSFNYTMMGGSVAWHFTGKRLSGWFVGPRAGFLTVGAEETATSIGGTTSASIKYSGSAMMFGGEAGYQWLWDNGFMLNLGAGANYVSMNLELEGSATTTSGTTTASASAGINGVLPTAMLNLGFAF